ncbi:MAG: hypothetical protein RLZZ383_245 [Pseudomonadota bacterium]
MRGALRWVGLACASLHCGGASGDATDTDGAADTSGVGADTDACAPDVAGTWETLGEGYVRTWCTPCHAGSLSGDARAGAPAGVDFDGLDDVHRWLDAIVEAATTTDGGSPRMPPGGGPSAADVAAFAAWLACDAPGEVAAPEACAVARIEPGDVTLSSPENVAAFCGRANTVGGALVVATDAPIACVCDVYGEVSIGGAATALVAPQLVGIGGALRLGAVGLQTVDLPALRSVAGDLDLRGAAGLAALSLPALREVAGSVWADRGSALATLSLPELASVGGDVRLIDASALATLAMPRLGTVGGGLVLSGLTSWATWVDFASLRSVGGDVVLTRDAQITNVEGINQLASVGGDVVFSELDALDGLSGLNDLVNVGGSLRIVDDPMLRGVDGFLRLETVGKALEIARAPQLVAVNGFGAVSRVGVEGDWVYGEHRLAWTDVPALTRAPTMSGLTRVGALEVLRADALDALDFPSLVVVDRQLAVVQVGGLRTLNGLAAVRRIGTDVAITGNPALPSAAVEAFLAAVGEGNIGGEVTAQNNGP